MEEPITEFSDALFSNRFPSWVFDVTNFYSKAVLAKVCIVGQ